MKLESSGRGKPTVNILIAAFNGWLRAECLNEDRFFWLCDASLQVERWRPHHNQDGPHRAIGCLAPTEFAASTSQKTQAG